MAGTFVISGIVAAGLASFASALPQTAIPVAISADVTIPAVPTASPIITASLATTNLSTTAAPLLDPSTTIAIHPITASLPDVIFPGVTLAPILPIIEQIGNAALSSIASDLASILSIFSSAANAINTTMPAVTMPSTCATTKSSSSTAFPTAVDPGLGSLLSSLAAVTSSSVSVPTAMLTASVAVSTPSNPSLTFSSMAPIVTSVDVSVPININPNVNLAAIVAGAVNASLTSLTLLSSALVLQAEQTLALLTLLANLNMGGLAGLATLTDLSSVQSSLRTISDLDLITVVNSLLTSASPGGKRDLAFFTTGLLEDPMAFIAVIESLTGTVDDIVASASYVIMQQLGTTGLTEALEGVETGDLPPTSSLLVEL